MILDEEGKPSKKYDERIVDIPYMAIYIYFYGFKSLMRMCVQFFTLTMIFKFLNTN